ncbi:MAG: bifunctional UDP-3-O-[3-hydroxymyristoyl] N-acetylglucosamine deacetylase/3-hydroxyacyl-ACP dehydratase [Cyclobacteriaceae bacterium]|nr:bifunctional UDP-3-O-[3-hydroxymyristoyl] N-acetylglucosamine deacetylase/3-hydroxyacyl-ACP dehydratase [Cyclobacteriaceae bacterium]MCH8515364.1 bifunctional UDP-3-O-[3-hydroxymyristoyl] N-acetylglucosamine deacetylase/3-hydroxyacyl-ACP dehydratase [Cyclobacteriaceae bacterium]
MNEKQHTIKESVSLSGIGLHTGERCNLTFLPAAPFHGIKFQRVDLEGQPIIEADVDYVVDVSRGTTLEKDGARVYTVEHVLAALVGLQLDNILIQMDGPEPPIMDGSAIEFYEALEAVGLEEQNALRNFFQLKEGISYSDESKDVEIVALPLNDYRVTVMVDYNSPVLGSQHANITAIDQFKKEIAPARTFCFLHELEYLHKNNLIKGGSLDSALVIVDRVVDEAELEHLANILNKPKVKVENTGTLNNVELRYKNEPARHKLLDVMGDVALLGRPIKAQIMAARPGHAANVEFTKKLKKAMRKEENSAVPYYDETKPPIYDINAISKILPHSYPFLLLDKVIHLDDTTVVGIKNVTMNEPFFMGHFHKNPVFPGVLQIESMAQTGGILVLNTVPDPENYWTYFLGIEKTRFKKMVLPGDTIKIKCTLLAPIKRGIAKMQGEAYVGNQLVCEATMTASIVRKDKK